MSTRTPENSLYHRGATARTGKQLAPRRGHRAYRKAACTTAEPPQAPEPSWHSNGRQLTPPRRDGKRPANARNARARASRDRTGKQLAPPRGHRTYRKTACTTVGSSHVPENSLHHRGPTARTRKQRAPLRGHHGKVCIDLRPVHTADRQKCFAPPSAMQRKIQVRLCCKKNYVQLFK